MKSSILKNATFLALTVWSLTAIVFMLFNDIWYVAISTAILVIFFATIDGTEEALMEITKKISKSSFVYPLVKLLHSYLDSIVKEQESTKGDEK